MTSFDQYQMQRKNVDRVKEIDGIRGWAALCVLIFHLTWELFGAVEHGFRSHIMKALFDGPLAVYIFFVLSGDALSLSFLSNSTQSMSRIIIKRYFRLTGPIFFSSLCVYCFMKLGLIFNADASRIVHREDWLGSVLLFKPNLYHLFTYSLYGVFKTPTDDLNYNPYLWPMGIELVGSLLVFAFGHVYHELKSPFLVLASVALLLGLLGSPYSLFFGGMCIGLARQRQLFYKAKNNFLLSSAFSLCLSLTLLFDAFAPNTLTEKIYSRIVMAFVIVLSIYFLKPATNFMKNSLSQFLGRISFPLYFMQFPIIASWSSWMILHWGFAVGQQASTYPIIGSSFIIIVGVSIAVERIEQKYLHFIDQKVKLLLKDDKNIFSEIETKN